MCRISKQLPLWKYYHFFNLKKQQGNVLHVSKAELNFSSGKNIRVLLSWLYFSGGLKSYLELDIHTVRDKTLFISGKMPNCWYTEKFK